EQVVRIHQPFLRVGAEEILGMADDELVQRRARRDEYAHRARTPAGPPKLLPGRRDGAGVADEDGALEAPDVDAQLERVRAHDAGDLARAQARLDLASMQGQVARAVTAHPLVSVESW